MPRRRGTSLETPRRLLGSAKILGLARMALNSAQDFVREGLGRPDVWQRVENDPARDLLHTTVYEYNLQGKFWGLSPKLSLRGVVGCGRVVQMKGDAL